MLAVALGVALPVGVSNAPGQTAADRQAIDATMAQLQRTSDYPGLNPALLSASGRNLLNLARRWPTLAGRLSASAGPLGEHSPKALFADNLVHSRYSGFTRSQTSTAWCGRNVVVAFNDTDATVATMASGRGMSQVGYATSHDRGQSFKYMGSLPPRSDPNTFVSGDPVVACSNRENFYVISTWLDGTNGISGVSLSTSSDGGRTFSAPALAVGKTSATHIIDHPWIAIDPNARNRIYVAYADLDFSGAVCGMVGGLPVPRYAIEVVSSSDSGATWSASPVMVDQVCADATHAFAFVNGAQLAVGPKAQIYVVWEAFGVSGGDTRALQFARSLDQAATFSTPLSITPVACAGDCSDWQGLFHSNEYPSLAIGKARYNDGTIYVAWNDGDRRISDSLSASGYYDYTDILLIHSTDGGTTWSKPRQVNNNDESSGAALTDQFEPALATDADGQIAVCFYDRRNDPRNFLVDRYCAHRRYGRWINRRITARRFPVLIGQDILVGPDYMGDYDTLASDFGGYWPGFVGAYATNRPGKPSIRTNRFRTSIY